MKLLVRADASPRMGTGHVMRCLSLVQGLRPSDGPAMLVAVEITTALEPRLQSAGVGLTRLNIVAGSAEDAEQTAKFAQEINASWIVVDGYQFSADYQRQLKDAGFRVLFMDDYGHAKNYSADLVLNQNLHATADYYVQRDTGTRLLLGTRHTLLRQEFQELKDWQRKIPAPASKVLVTLGGADPDNVTSDIVKALGTLPGVEAVVVVGGSNPHLPKLRSLIANSPKTIQLVVDAQNMPELMQRADVAVAAGGTTSWELAFMGLPTLMLVLADNQRTVADGLSAAQVVRKTTPETVAQDLAGLLADATARTAMSERGRQLVDGLGTSRVVTAMRAGELTVRRVQPDDCRQIWEWSNDPEVRKVSLSQGDILWETHVKWFSSHVNSPTCFFYVGADHDRLVGQIRFDLNGPEATLSISLSREARGHGYGPALIVRGSQQFFADSNATLIRAYVNLENTVSLRAFEKAGYAPAENTLVQEKLHRQFVLKRN